ncbi:MAG: dihydrodipicolinate synthase family protein [candidate division NC10 bacterium]|nr:dihydrodipicolinate synthase family protein [candidate division NC10 bacterium]
MSRFAGVLPPVTTPFGPDGSLALEKLVANLTAWHETGLSGYLLLGSNAEAVTLTEEEKVRVLETARAHIPRDRLLLAGTGEEGTAATIALTNAAARLGVDAAMVVTPGYYKGQMRARELIAHYTAVADASSLPVLIYNVPQFTGVTVEPEVVGRLAEHENIVGMKDSAGNVATLTEYLRVAPEGFAVFVGSAAIFYAGLALGACGGILALANAAPRACVELYSFAREGKGTEAAALQRRLLPAVRAVTARFGIGGLKHAMDLLGYYGGPPRPPLLPPTEPERAEIRKALTESGLLEG